jgi:hypothetical protein
MAHPKLTLHATQPMQLTLGGDTSIQNFVDRWLVMHAVEAFITPVDVDFQGVNLEPQNG